MGFAVAVLAGYPLKAGHIQVVKHTSRRVTELYFGTFKEFVQLAFSAYLNLQT